MREADNIREVETLGIDMMGFIFWPKSSRYVSQRPDYLPKRVKRVGVFVDENPEKVKRLAGEYGLDYIQLHGQESPSYIFQLRGLHVIKAFNISTAEDLLQTQSYEGLVDGFLFDAKGKSVGGVSSMPIRAPRPSCSVVASVQTTQSGLMPFIILSASASISTPASNSLQASKTS